MKNRIFRIFLALCLCLAASGCKTPAAKQTKHFSFVQMGDPQFGFGGFENDTNRFAQAVEQINRLHPDFVVICGDLVNSASESSFAVFNDLKRNLKVPAYCAPGNHDIGNTPTPETLSRFRKMIGKDYFKIEQGGFEIVVANTQLWKSPLPGESERHDAWFKAALEEAAAKHRPIIVVAHYPLFVADPDEVDNYFNIPSAKRKELLALFKRCGVVAMLAGHTHTTMVRKSDGVEYVNSQTTSKNFDNQPFGFTLWSAGANRALEHQFVPLDRGLSTAPSQ